MIINDIITQYKYYKQLGDRTFAQVPDEGLFYAPHAEANNIVTLVKHLRGNMLSRWTDFLTSDGEKEWRHRDTEFEAADITSRTMMLAYWEEGWSCLLDTLDSLTDNDIEKTIYIRGEALSVRYALLRQLGHYAYHVGQIVYLGKMVMGTEWNSLSIPKNASEAFNASMRRKE